MLSPNRALLQAFYWVHKHFYRRGPPEALQGLWQVDEGFERCPNEASAPAGPEVGP